MNFSKMSFIYLLLILQVAMISQCYGKGYCNGDFNALIVQCPSPCPPTCQTPFVKSCNKRCRHHGCQCRPSYILSKAKNGRCIHPRNCPGKPLCPQNETYVNCKVGCPTDYCSAAYVTQPIVCDPPHPCPSGCVCKPNYLRRSYEDSQCIHISECPRPIVEPKILWPV